MAQVNKRKGKARQREAGQAVAKRHKTLVRADHQPSQEKVYIKYPDAPLMVSWDDLAALSPLYKCALRDGPEYLMMDVYSERFEEEGKPLDALHILSMAHFGGVYPPLHVLKFLAEGVQLYLESAGHKSLEQCFGLGAAKRVFGVIRDEERRWALCLDLIVWKKIFHKPTTALGPVVARQYNEVASVARYFKTGERKEWRQARRQAEATWENFGESWMRGENPNFRRNFISKYPLALLKEYPQIFGHEILFHHKDVPRARSRS